MCDFLNFGKIEPIYADDSFFSHEIREVVGVKDGKLFVAPDYSLLPEVSSENDGATMIVYNHQLAASDELSVSDAASTCTFSIAYIDSILPLINQHINNIKESLK